MCFHKRHLISMRICDARYAPLCSLFCMIESVKLFVDPIFKINFISSFVFKMSRSQYFINVFGAGLGTPGWWPPACLTPPIELSNLRCEAPTLTALQQGQL